MKVLRTPDFFRNQTTPVEANYDWIQVPTSGNKTQLPQFPKFNPLVLRAINNNEKGPFSFE